MSTNMQDALDEVNDKLDNELQNVDIRLNQSSGEVEWRQRGADTWTPFKSGLAVCPIYVRIYGQGDQYDSATGWREACGIVSSAGHYSSMSIATMTELSGAEYIPSDYAATYQSNDYSGHHSETQAHIYNFNMPNNSKIDVIIMTQIQCGWWYNSESNSSSGTSTAYVHFGKDGSVERVGSIPEGYTLLTELLNLSPGSRSYYRSYAYVYIKQ